MVLSIMALADRGRAARSRVFFCRRMTEAGAANRTQPAWQTRHETQARPKVWEFPRLQLPQSRQCCSVMSGELAQPVHPNTKRTKIRSVGVLSMATTQAIIMMAMALVFALIYAVLGGGALLFGGIATSSSGAGSPSPLQLAGVGVGVMVALIIFMPIAYGAMGFIFGALGAVVYNLVAKWTGGLEIELLDREEARPH